MVGYHIFTPHSSTHHIHHTSLSPSHPPGVASPSHGRPTSHHLSPCTPPHTCYTLPRDEMRALMKVASFIIATLFIPPYPTNLVITTSPRDIRVRFHPPPLIMNDSYNVACSLGRVAPLSPSGCHSPDRCAQTAKNRYHATDVFPFPPIDHAHGWPREGRHTRPAPRLPTAARHTSQTNR